MLDVVSDVQSPREQVVDVAIVVRSERETRSDDDTEGALKDWEGGVSLRWPLYPSPSPRDRTRGRRPSSV